MKEKLIWILAAAGIAFIVKAEMPGSPKIATFEAPTHVVFTPTIEPQAATSLSQGDTIRTAVQPQVLVLTKENTLSFEEVVTPESVAKFQDQLQTMSNKLDKNAEITVVLYTPGGDVVAGMQLIDSVRAVPQKVNTLTVFSASMGFHFVQGMGDRMILPSGTLMSHRAKGGMEGEFDGSLDVRIKAIYRKTDYLSSIAAYRMGRTLPEYKDLIRDEYWKNGQDAVDDNSADKVVLARCDDSLSGTYDKIMYTMFGPITLVMSNCPLITSPLDYKIEEESLSTFFHMYYERPDDFLHEFIINGKYHEFIK